MIAFACTTRVATRVAALSALAVVVCQMATAQQTQGAPADAPVSPAHGCQPMNWTTEQDHRNMMDQLGIKALRPGPSGNENAPDHANYDEARANPFPNLPDPLTMNDERKVTTAKMWMDERRPEIADMYEKYVYGRV